MKCCEATNRGEIIMYQYIYTDMETGKIDIKTTKFQLLSDEIELDRIQRAQGRPITTIQVREEK